RGRDGNAGRLAARIVVRRANGPRSDRASGWRRPSGWQMPPQRAASDGAQLPQEYCAHARMEMVGTIAADRQQADDLVGVDQRYQRGGAYGDSAIAEQKLQLIP